MHFNKIKIIFMFFVFLGLMSYSLGPLTTKTVYAVDYRVNENNNYSFDTSPNTPADKDYALQNIDCVMNFMQSYVLTSSSVPGSQSCNKDGSETTNDNANEHQSDQGQYLPPSDNTQQTFQQDTGDANEHQSDQGQYLPPSDNTQQTFQQDTGDANEHQSNQGQYLPPSDNTQQTFQQDTGVGIVKVISLNGSSNTNELAASDSNPSYYTPAVAYTGNMQNGNSDDNGEENKDDNGEENVYNENTVTKEERKILLKTCFERAEDKGNYISSTEIKKCAENYNS